MCVGKDVINKILWCNWSLFTVEWTKHCSKHFNCRRGSIKSGRIVMEHEGAGSARGGRWEDQFRLLDRQVSWSRSRSPSPSPTLVSWSLDPDSLQFFISRFHCCYMNCKQLCNAPDLIFGTLIVHIQYFYATPRILIGIVN